MNQTYYDEKLETLPENLRYSVIMSDWKKSLVEIQNKFKLHIDQTQVLEDSVMKLMFGDIDAPDFIANLFNEGHINSETAADILLEVDLKILKNIRERLEKIEQADKEEEEVDNILLDDDEREAREESEDYSEYYEKAAQIMQDTEDQLLAEGIKEDGSNITDEMLGIVPEIPNDIKQEKNDLLAEIDTPTKSFTANPIIKTVAEIPAKPAEEYNPIPANHQLENTHLEEPYHQEITINKLDIRKDEPQPTTTQTSTPVTVPEEPKLNKEPEIKKPININLNDIYREPIE